MIFERIKSEGLAHNSYIIGSSSGVAVIDPRRDCQVYLDLARQKSVRIRHIFETHRNEDYIVGSLELNGLTGADIYHGPGLAWKYGNTLKDGQEFRVGRLVIKAIHTPGHTDESMSYAVTDPSSGDATVMVFTGDTLFVDDTGRADLYGIDQTPRLAGNIYDSIWNRLMPLGDGAILCPAHGEGSVCGMNIGDRDESTIGIERLQNPALQIRDRNRFIEYKLAEKPEVPPYFTRMEKYNLEGPPILGRLPQPPPLSPKEFKTEIENGATLIDTSKPAAFGGAHIRGAHNIWLEGLAALAGWFLPYDRALLLVLENPSHLELATRYLVRLGYDHIAGYLKDGIGGWYNAGLPVEGLPLLSIQQLKDRLDRREPLTVLDVRDQDEWDSGHIDGAIYIYVGHLEQRLSEVPGDRPVAVMCSVGNRAGIGASILLRAGYPTVYNVLGSITAWKSAGFPLVSD